MRTSFDYLFFPFSWHRQVIEGLDTLVKMEGLDTYNERPVNICKISNCGVVDIKKLFWPPLMDTNHGLSKFMKKRVKFCT